METETAGAAEEGTAVSEEVAVTCAVGARVVGAMVVVSSVGESVVGASEAPGGISAAILVVAFSTTDRSKPKRKSMDAGFRVIAIVLVSFRSCLRDISDLQATEQPTKRGSVSVLLGFQRSLLVDPTKQKW